MTSVTTTTEKRDGGFRVSTERRVRLLRLATWWSVGTAVVLILAKGAAWLNTGSVSLLASLIDSLMDAAASVMNLFAVRYALRPPDEEHRFGHGKAESLAALAQAAFITGSAVLLTFEAVNRLVNPEPLSNPLAGIWVMVFAIFATLLLLAVQRYVVRETGSVAIRADSLHYLTDLLTNLVTIAAIALFMAGFERADALLALAIAAYIFYSAAGIGMQAVQDLMDRELSDELQRRMTSATAWGVEARVPFLDKDFLDVAMRIDPADKMIRDGRIEKQILREAFSDLLPEEIAWRQKEQFSDGVGYGWIDAVRDFTAGQVSDAEMARAEGRFPHNPPASKEAYWFRSVFEQHFPLASAAQCVPGGPTVACSTPEAVLWDAALQQMNDPSGRAMKNVHKDSY